VGGEKTICQIEHPPRFIGGYPKSATTSWRILDLACDFFSQKPPKNHAKSGQVLWTKLLARQRFGGGSYAPLQICLSNVVAKTNHKNSMVYITQYICLTDLQRGYAPVEICQ
jgi:hypothetical protein